MSNNSEMDAMIRRILRHSGNFGKHDQPKLAVPVGDDGLAERPTSWFRSLR
jgi:hypothetical protein